MITQGSRYAQNSVSVLKDAETGEQRLTIQRLWPTSFVITYQLHQWVDGDRIDLVASTYLGDPSLWWVIADANPEIMDWESIYPNTAVRIPDA